MDRGEKALFLIAASFYRRRQRLIGGADPPGEEG
jgi:hypothetical protein